MILNGARGNEIICGAKVASQNNGVDAEFSLIDTGFRRDSRRFAVKVLDLDRKLRIRGSFWFSVDTQMSEQMVGGARWICTHISDSAIAIHLTAGGLARSQWMHCNHACDVAFR